MICPAGNSAHRFLGFASGNIEGLGEAKLTVCLGASHQVLIIYFLISKTPRWYQAVFRYEIPLKKIVSIILETCHVKSILFPFLGVNSIFDFETESVTKRLF